MKTVVPTVIRLYNHSASGIRMRMQPCDTEYPIEPGSGVPWMPTPGSDAHPASPERITRAGRDRLLVLRPRRVRRIPPGVLPLDDDAERPSGVGYWLWPVATPNRLTNRIPL